MTSSFSSDKPPAGARPSPVPGSEIPQQVQVRVSEPGQLPQLAAQLRGYGARPGDVVHLGFGGGQLQMCSSFNAFDLPPGGDALDEAALHIAAKMAPHTDRVIVLAYGDPATVNPAADAAITALETGYQIAIQAAYRIDGDRMFCLLCQDCTPGGIVVAAQPVPGLDPAVHADRDALAAQYDYILSPGMPAAVDQAVSRYASTFSHLPSGSDRDREVAAAGRQAVDDALAGQRNATVLDDEHAAWLMLLMAHPRVCQYIWAHAIDTNDSWQLWAHLTRRAPKPLAAPVAVVLALSSLLRGDGATANIAADLALQADPGYLPTKAVLGILRQATSPKEIRASLDAVLARIEGS